MLFSINYVFRNTVNCISNIYVVVLNFRLCVIYVLPWFLFSSDRKLPLKEENGKEALNPETIEIKVANDIIQSTEDDSKA